MLRKIFYKYSHDLVVIGGGPGGYVAAIKAAQLGLKTVCVEKRGALGGTCLNVGCIPSKALLNISHKYEAASHHYKKYGINTPGISIDWSVSLKKKDQIVGSLTKGIEGLFAKNKVDYVKGLGKLKGPNQVEVQLNEGGIRNIEAKNILIATGSDPTPFPGLPFDEKVIISSTGALSLQKIPKKLIVIGGGVIGVEMASVYVRLGTDVTVIEFMDKLCPFLDDDISKAFLRSLQKQGIKFMLGHKVTSATNLGDSAEISIEPVKGGESVKMTCDHLLVSTGRKPHTDNLGLEDLGIKKDERGRIQIDQYFQTNIPSIHAIGDVVPGPMLAHKSEEEGIACVEYISGRGGHVNYETIPSVIYTNPECASVGKTEQQLLADKIEYSKGSFPFLANSRAKANDDTEGLIKVLTDKKTDKILGVHIMGSSAGEMIAEAVLGMEYGASAEDIGRTCHAHPTLSEAFKEACMQAYGKAIHF